MGLPPPSWQKILLRSPRIDWVGPGAFNGYANSVHVHSPPSSWQKILLRGPRIDWVGPGAFNGHANSVHVHLGIFIKNRKVNDNDRNSQGLRTFTIARLPKIYIPSVVLGPFGPTFRAFILHFQFWNSPSAVSGPLGPTFSAFV